MLKYSIVQYLYDTGGHLDELCCHCRIRETLKPLHIGLLLVYLLLHRRTADDEVEKHRHPVHLSLKHNQ